MTTNREFMKVPITPDLYMDLWVIAYNDDTTVTSQHIERMIECLELTQRGFRDGEQREAEFRRKVAEQLKQGIVKLISDGTPILRHVKSDDWYINGDARKQPVNKAVVRQLLDAGVLKIIKEENHYRLATIQQWQDQARVIRLSATADAPEQDADTLQANITTEP